MFFEPNRSIGEKVFSVMTNKRITFPVHIHRSFEMIAQIEGETEVTVDGKRYNVKNGEAVLVFPFQQHSYKCIKEGELEICLFSPDMTDAFYNAGKLPKENHFVFNAKKCSNNENFYIKKAYVYSIIGTFDKNREYEICEKVEDNALVNTLIYAEENFCNKCILKDVAKKLGYDYAYLSKLFKRKITLPFNDYVNVLRVNKSKALLLGSDKSVTEIAGECGYSSLRSFDRAFFLLENITPTDYRKQEKSKYF